MRVLTAGEAAMVSGGGVISDALESAHTGGELMAIAGYVVRGTAAGAARGGLSGAALGFAWSIGTAIGTAFYEALCY